MKRWVHRLLFGYRSIKWNMALGFSVLILVSINGVGYFAYVKHAEGARENARNSTYEIVNQVSRNAEYYIRYMEDISTLTYFNKNIQKYLSERADSSNYELNAKRTLEEVSITEYFNSFLSIRRDISSIYIFGNDNQMLTNRPNINLKEYISIKEQNWYRKAKEAKGSVVITPTHVQSFIKDEYQWVVSLSREIYHLDTKKSLGVFLIDLNFNVIRQICDDLQLGKSGYVFVVDQEGGLIYHPQQQLIYSKVKQENIDLILGADDKFLTESAGGRDKMYTIITSANTGWKFVGVTYMDELVPNVTEFRNSIILLGLISLPLTLIVSTAIASRISRPIHKLERLMGKVEKGQFDVKIDIEGHKEVAQLSRSFNIMVGRISDLMEQVLEEQEQKRQSELKALQAQINPHFLYNTLDSAIWMAQRGKTGEVIQLISSLARLFRLSLSKGEQWVFVKDEVEHVRHYLLIQQLRYKSKLDFVIEVEQDLMRYQIPRLILQPLVENAIYHGIKPMPDGGFITIRGYVERVELTERTGSLVFEVFDNGAGIPPDKLERIFEGDSSKLHGGGVGIRNIQDRIRLYAGYHYGLHFSSEVGQGTLVRVELPVIVDVAVVGVRAR